MQLNKVVLPVLASPIIPQRNGIDVGFKGAKVVKKMIEDRGWRMEDGGWRKTED